jgi:D-3-phosphoglycerate dehydrogenase
MARTPSPILVIDFDSTIVRVESLDLLAVVSLAERTDGTAKAAEISEITRLGMEGKLDFRESLTRRVGMLECTQAQVEEVARKLVGMVSPSFAAHRDQLKECRDRIYVITGGFRDLALATIESLGLRPDHLFANHFTYSPEGLVTGFDEANPLCQAGGKVKVVQGMGLQGDAIMVGDGYTDYQVKESGAAGKFYYFAEVVKRSPFI